VGIINISGSKEQRRVFVILLYLRAGPVQKMNGTTVSIKTQAVSMNRVEAINDVFTDLFQGKVAHWILDRRYRLQRHAAVAPQLPVATKHFIAQGDFGGNLQ